MLSLLWVVTACTGLPGGRPNDLPGLMAERLGWMEEVALVKHLQSRPVTDARREAELLDAMALEGGRLGLPGTAVRAFFTGQIEAAKECQREWLAHHASATMPLDRKAPDLATTVRPALDAIGRRMLAALADTRGNAEVPTVVSAARMQLMRAGYSEAVIKPALNGLLAGLR